MKLLFIYISAFLLFTKTTYSQVELIPLPLDKINYDSLINVIQQKEVSKDYRALGLLYGGICNYYLYSSFKDSAIIYGDKAEGNAYKAGDSATYYFLQLQFGEFYTNALDFKAAKARYEKALRYYLRTKNYVRQGSSFGGLSYMYELKKDTLNMLKHLDLLEKSNQLSHDTTYIVSANHFRIQLLIGKRKLDSAIRLLHDNLSMIDRATTFGNGNHIRNFWRELEVGLLAQTYYQKQDYRSAVKFLRQVKPFDKNQSDFNDQMVFRQRDLIKSFINLNEKDSAEKYIDIFFDGTRKAITNLSPERLNEITSKYESEKKQLHISELERKNLLHQLAVADQRKLNLIITIVFFVVLSAVFLYVNNVRYHRKRAIDLAKQEMRYKDELHKKHELEMRDRISRDLHDDVGATLSSIKVYSEMLESTPDRKTISGLIKENAAEMIDRLEVIAWATNPNHDRFKSLTDTMIKFSVPIMHASKIEFRFDMNKSSDDIVVPGDVRQNIFLIFKEAINNTVKHAAATTCNVSLYVKDSIFHMEVEDNGIGLELSEKRSSRSGIKNMERRAADLQGSIQVFGKKGEGTTVKLLIPYPFQTSSS